ncbi:MAG: hypothetical protein K5697_08410, partial [Lachnospiraceae bacterium]|nr:hypothetical protein [Lachnospiraceae bacterium]
MDDHEGGIKMRKRLKLKQLLASILTIAFVFSEAGTMPVVWAKGESEEAVSEEILLDDETSVNVTEDADTEQAEIQEEEDTEIPDANGGSDPDESAVGVNICDEEETICVS